MTSATTGNTRSSLGDPGVRLRQVATPPVLPGNGTARPRTAAVPGVTRTFSPCWRIPRIPSIWSASSGLAGALILKSSPSKRRRRGSLHGSRQHKPATKPRCHRDLNSCLRREQLRNTHQDGERRMLTNEELDTVSGGEQAAPKALISVEIPGLSLNY